MKVDSEALKVSAETSSEVEQDEEVPGKCNALIKEENAEFEAALRALDGKGQRVVGQLLAGQRTVGAAEKLSAGQVEVLSGGIVTSLKRTDKMSDGDRQGRTMRAALKIAGITETYLANTLKAGLRASKHVKSLTNKGKLKKTPDYATRLRYLELAHRLRGDMTQAEKAGQETYEERIRVIMARKPEAIEE